MERSGKGRIDFNYKISETLKSDEFEFSSYLFHYQQCDFQQLFNLSATHFLHLLSGENPGQDCFILVGSGNWPPVHGHGSKHSFSEQVSHSKTQDSDSCSSSPKRILIDFLHFYILS